MHLRIVIPNYNSAALVERCVSTLLRQSPRPADSFEVVVVDDGSTDDSAGVIERAFGTRIRLIRLPTNQGRSTGRNAGAASSGADVLVFVDSDCLPDRDDFLVQHALAIEGGADVSFGQVRAPGSGFWDELQRVAFRDREASFKKGDTWAFTTQNVAMSAQAFHAAGGFDAAFDKHGFEDRDLFIRLERAGTVATYTPGASVLHMDRLSLASVSRKFENAGRYSSVAFRDRHSGPYRRMAFSRFDASLHPFLRAVSPILWAALGGVSRGRSDWLESRAIPFRARLFLARFLYGIAYMHGTWLALRDARGATASR